MLTLPPKVAGENAKVLDVLFGRVRSLGVIKKIFRSDTNRKRGGEKAIRDR